MGCQRRKRSGSGKEAEAEEEKVRDRPEAGGRKETKPGKKGKILVAMRLRGTPVLIPNTKVKT